MNKLKAFFIKNRLSLAAAGVLAVSVAVGAVVLHAQGEAEHVVSVAEVNMNRSQVLFSGEDYYLQSDQEDQYLEERAREELQKEQTVPAVQQEDPSELAPSIVTVEKEPEEEEEYVQDQDFEVEEYPDQETDQADENQNTDTDQQKKKKPESQEKNEEASNTYRRSTQGRSSTGSTNRYVSPSSRYNYGRSTVTRTPTPTPTSGAKKKKESTYTAEIPTPVPTTKVTVTPTPTTKTTVTPTPTTKVTVTPTPTTKPTVAPTKTPTPTPEPDIHISFRTPEAESGTEPVYGNEKELNHESSIPELHVVSGEKLEFRLQGKDYKNHTFDVDEYTVILTLPDGREVELTGQKSTDEDTGDVYIVYKTENPLEEGIYEINVTVKDTDYTVSCIVTAEPVKTPTPEPTEPPTPEPTETPTPEPTEAPTPEPTETPAPELTDVPELTETPTPGPTETP
ncbi:MAG: hypothetical protein IJI10_10220 [Eubacterium sp.]|nr:hypothetical protein [Eubacterium sp.]